MHIKVHNTGFLFNDFPHCCVGFLKAELLNVLILSDSIWIFLETLERYFEVMIENFCHSYLCSGND